MIYPESFSPNTYKLEYTIYSCFIYNPKIQSKKKKILEEDIQDAKLLYYYPKEAHIEEKRNNVGLAEGMILFWGPFNIINPSTKTLNSTKTQVIYLDKYIHIVTNFEPDYWLSITLSSHTKELIYYSNNNSSNTYGNEDSFRIEKPNLPFALCEKFVQHFISYFELFYGNVSMYIVNDRLNEQFDIIFTNYVKNYQRINSSWNPNTPNTIYKLNMMKYYDRYVNYAPIEKKSFLALHYLLNILNSINKNIKHFTVFYYGYFIYSTLEHKIAQMFSDYFYSNSDSFEIDPNKLFTKFIKLDNNQSESWDKICTYGIVLDIKGNKGFLTGYSETLSSSSPNTNGAIQNPNENSKILKNSGVNGEGVDLSTSQSSSQSQQQSSIHFKKSESIEENYITDETKEESSSPIENGNQESSKQQQKTDKLFFAPIIWIKNPNGTFTSYKICVYYDSGLLVVMYFNNDHEINFNSLNEIRYAISKNIKKCSMNLDRNIESIYAQEDTNRLYYLNKANLAMRVNKSFLKSIEQEISRLIAEMKVSFSCISACRLLVSKYNNLWIYAKEYTNRRVFLLIDGEISMSKLEEEKRRIVSVDLPTILM